jgi:thiol-disulfide isomerase/thioredoxin
MKPRLLLVALWVSAGIALATVQVHMPKDPELIDAQGYHKILLHYRGKLLLVTFWATWCEPCRDEYPMLNELAKEYAPKGLQVVGVDFDQDGDLILMRRFLARYKPVFPNYRKKKGEEDAFSEAVMPGYKGALPASFFYTRDGKQVGHVVGAGDRDTYEAAIRSLLAK